MRHLHYKKVITAALAFSLFSSNNLWAQEEVIIGSPAQTIADTGVIFQDTSNGKIYSYRNHELGTQELAFNYTVDSTHHILDMNVPTNTCIHVKATGASYVTQEAALTNFTTDSCVVVPTKNGKYAILQLKDGGYYIEFFGAVPDDNLDDQPAIQKAMDAISDLNDVASSLAFKATSRVNAGAGTFNLSKGVVAEHRQGSTNNLVTFTLSGSIPTYSSNKGNGSTTVFELEDSTFCLAIQRARNCLVENIVFIGGANYTEQNMTVKNIMNWDTDDWGGTGTNVSINEYAPSCGIAIDPFRSNATASQQYPGFSEYYTNGYSGTGGSSMITIRGCTFKSHYFAIANNPSTGLQNGDNIRVENCRGNLCHTFWASGQTQSRTNSIDNVYVTYVHSFLGHMGGNNWCTPPVVTNLNLAGFTKYVVDLNTGQFSSVRFSNSYMEAIWSLGRAQATHVSFDQCEIKFKIPTPDSIFSPPYHIKGSGAVEFNDCDIKYFSNCTYKHPFNFEGGHVRINGGLIEGGVVVNYGRTQYNGGNLHKVTYNDVKINCLSPGIMIGNRHSSDITLHLNEKALMGGEELLSYTVDGEKVTIGSYKMKFKNNEDTYHFYAIEHDSIIVDSITKTARIVSSDTGRYKVGDNLFMHNPYGTSSIGFVSEIDHDTIILSGIPHDYKQGSGWIYGVDYPRFILPIFGDFTNGNDTIKRVLSYNLYGGATNQEYPEVGFRIFNELIPAGAYVKSVDKEDSIIVLTSPAIGTDTTRLFYNAPYNQTIYTEKWPITAQTPVAAGTKILLNKPTGSYYGYFCEKGGIIGTSRPPTFHALNY